MLKNHLLLSICLLGSMLLLIACEPDGKELDTSLLAGRWELSKGFSKDKEDKVLEPTERLNGAFFNFEDEGKMTTNILGAASESTYQINRNKITQEGERKINYTIEKLTADSLTLTTKLSGINFKLLLNKK